MTTAAMALSSSMPLGRMTPARYSGTPMAAVTATQAEMQSQSISHAATRRAARPVAKP